MRNLWLATLLLCTFTATWAQDVTPPVIPRLRMGIAVGGEFTTFINNPFNYLISQINIPGATIDLALRLRLGRHFSLQLSPGYTYRPYRSHRVFIGEGLDENGNPDAFFGKEIDRSIRSDLHEGRIGLLAKYHFRQQEMGWHIGIGLEAQRIQLRDFDFLMLQDSAQVIHAAAEVQDLPWLLGTQIVGGYTHPLPKGHHLSVEPCIKYSPLFTEDAKILSWGSAGIKVGIWI